ncbi:MAG: hypothetical protein K0S04_2255, partial [Herbinix sp.]|nr:hypothetical protein [Herbinix sp.]
MINKTLQIQGMTCASCAKTVERVTTKLEGVAEANVNFATEKLIIQYDSSIVKISDIKNVIVKAGYKAIDEAIAVDDDQERREKERKVLWRRFIISAIFTTPLLYMAMGHMLNFPL